MNILLIALVLIALLVLVFLWRRQQKTSGNARKSEEISKPDIVREDPHIPTTQS